MAKPKPHLEKNTPAWDDFVVYYEDTAKSYPEIRIMILEDHGVNISADSIPRMAKSNGLERKYVAERRAERIKAAGGMRQEAIDDAARLAELNRSMGSNVFGQPIPREVIDNPITKIPPGTYKTTGGYRLGMYTIAQKETST